MSRLQVLAGSPRRTLGALAVVLAAVGITVGSSAKFTATSANPSNTFSTGTLSIDNDHNNAAIFSASNMKPGDYATGEVVIKNSGSLTGAFSLRASITGQSTPSLFAPLKFTITDCGTGAGATCDPTDTKILDGAPLSTLTSGAMSLGDWAAGEQHRYEFRADLPLATDNTYQGTNGTATFTWDATTN